MPALIAAIVSPPPAIENACDAPIAAAMVTGHEAWITPEQTDAMRASGLAHILSISGLHIGMVAGIVFAGVRVMLALVPPLALRWNSKKIAAVAAFAAITFYMPFTEFTDKRYRLMFEVQVRAPFELSQMVVPSMRERGGGCDEIRHPRHLCQVRSAPVVE